MYAKPTLAPLDPTTAAASCCRIVISAGDTPLVEVVNRPLCPFPLPTGTVCASADPGSVLDPVTLATSGGILPTLPVVTICAFPT